MRRHPWLAAAFVALLVPVAAFAGTKEIVIIHVNDVYEVQGVGGEGGMARLATVVHGLRAASRDNLTILAGDALSPSGMSSVLKNGGEQMAAAMNFLVVQRPLIEYAVLGNHEFDLKPKQFNERIQDGKTQWFSGNVQLSGEWVEVPRFQIAERGGLRIGLIGATIDSNVPAGVTFARPAETLMRDVQAVRKEGADLIVAVTHLNRPDDLKIAQIEGIDVVLGGHDHQASVDGGDQCREEDATVHCLPRQKSAPVFKADANARTFWRHVITVDTGTRKLVSMQSSLETLSGLPHGQLQKQVVEEFQKRLASDRGIREAFGSAGVTTAIGAAGETLDGREACVRNPANCTDDGAMLRFAASAAVCALVGDNVRPDVVLYNGGLIRIDDTIARGTALTPLDLLRINPFGDEFVIVRAAHGDVAELIAVSHQQCAGKGCWLHAFRTHDELRETYTLALPMFLLNGKEEIVGERLKTWKRTGDDRGDIRKGMAAVIAGKCQPRVQPFR